MTASRPIRRPYPDPVLMGLLLVLAACSGSRPPRPESTLAPGAPAFDPRVARLHIEGLRGGTSPSTGSTAVVAAASYAAEVFALAQLQPLTAGEYRQVWFGPLNRASDAAVARLGRDTLLVRSGPTLQADGRSDRGRVEAASVWRVAASAAARPAQSTVAWIEEADTTTEALSRMASAGVRAVLVPTGRVEPVAREPVRGLVVVAVAPEELARLFPRAPRQGLLRRPVAVEVAATFDPASPVVGAAGLVPGRDPWAREDLVVVAAGLDVAPGEPPLEAAAVVEAARILGDMASRGASPAATTLFLLWSGSRQGGTGAAAWARNPGWEAGRIRRIVVAGNVPESVRSLGRPVVSVGREGPDDDPAGIAMRLAHRLLASVAPDLGISVPYLPDPRTEPE